MDYAEKNHNHRGIETPRLDYNDLKNLPSVVGNCTLTFCNTQVFSGADSNSWKDLDLSGTIGAITAIVMLKVVQSTGSNVHTFRQNGEAGTFATLATNTTGLSCCGTLYSSPTNYQGNTGYAICKTDSAGIVEWRSYQIGGDVVVTLIAYLKLS